MKKFRSILVFTAALFLFAVTAKAQGPGFDDDVVDGAVDLPIDGGASLLIAAAAGYGAKKLYARRKKQETAEEETAAK